MKIITLAVFLLGYFAVCCQAQCSQGTTSTWSTQPFVTDVDSLEDPDGTPLGFAQLIFPGTDNMNTQRPCIEVNFPPEANGTSRYLTVLVESLQGNICIERVDNSQQAGAEKTCGSGRVPPLCVEVDAQTVQVELSCDSSCQPGDIGIFYRVSTDYRESNEEMFCDNINITYPTSLIPPPTQPVDVVIETRPTGGAAAISSLFLQALLLVSLLAMLLM